MNKNEIALTIKTQSGGTWSDAEFNIHQHVRQVLQEALAHFHLDTRLSYEVLLVRGSSQQNLPLDETLEAAGVQSGDTLLVRPVGRTIDG